jgi:hypothetical protein
MRNRGFIEKYRDAFRGHMAGLAKVVFPFGAYWMNKFGKVACEAVETAERAILGTPMEPVPA